MTNETEFAGLLPCPFCGGEAEFKPYKKDGLTIKCKSFGCVRRDQRVLRQSIDWLREAMAKDWNTRTNPPPVDAAAERDAVVAEMTRLYTDGYVRGHHETVEGQYTDVLYRDSETYFLDDLLERLEDSDYRHLAALAAQQQENKQ